MNRNIKTLSVIFLTILVFTQCSKNSTFTVHPSPEPDKIVTEKIQHAIDTVGEDGGGIVHFSKGTYIIGGLYLRDNTTLLFDKGVIVQSSNNLADFGEWHWSKALIMGDSLTNISIIGQAVIDGIDLKNPDGEEGFRGPHAIRLTNCDSVTIKDITIKRSANWAINCRKCSNGVVDNVTILAGHDGVHTRFCKNFHIKNSDVRTGDDAFAGNDNQNFIIENCKANTSCNAFRFGCLGLVLKKVTIWGPGEHQHLSQHRNNTLSAFTHFSPPDENPQLKSGDWFLQDVTIDNVDQIFNYNFKDGLWQTGQPLTNVTFENLKATNVKKAFNMIGDSTLTLNLQIRNSSISELKDSNFNEFTFEGKRQATPAFFNVNGFNTIELQNVTIETNSKKTALYAKNASQLILKNVHYIPTNNKNPLDIENINEVKISKNPH